MRERGEVEQERKREGRRANCKLFMHVVLVTDLRM